MFIPLISFYRACVSHRYLLVSSSGTESPTAFVCTVSTRVLSDCRRLVSSCDVLLPLAVLYFCPPTVLHLASVLSLLVFPYSLCLCLLMCCPPLSIRVVSEYFNHLVSSAWLLFVSLHQVPSCVLHPALVFFVCDRLVSTSDINLLCVLRLSLSRLY